MVGGALLVAGGTALGGLRASAAAPSKTQDAEILDVFLLLERVQEAFYSQAVRRGRLRGELLQFAQAAGRQETEHVRFLTERLGGRAGAAPATEFADALEGEESFRSTAIELEEAAIGAYIAQGGKKSDYVGKVLLPRAELVEAQKAGTVEAIDAYTAAHPGSAIAQEVKDARKKALLDELDRAKKVGTVALRPYAVTRIAATKA